MMKKIIFISLLITFLAGCAGNVISKNHDNPILSPTTDDSLLVSSLSDDGFVYILGNYELNVDRNDLSAKLVSKRGLSIGESWIVSGKSYFTMTPCSDCLKINSIGLTNENLIALDFAIKHPFQPGDPFKPPTGKNRLDLDIFDTALIFLPLNTTPTSYTLINKTIHQGWIANNDGYSTELSALLNNDSALPYVLIVDDSLSGTSTWNKFAMGAEVDFDVLFNLKNQSILNFDLFLTFGYGASATLPQRLNPTYFNPEFNRKAAWKVDVIPPEGDNPPAIGNTWKTGDTSTLFDVTVKVYDWQHGVTSISNPPQNPEDIAFASNVDTVSVEIPGMNTSLKTTINPESGTGSPNDPLVFRIPIANELDLSPGEYVSLVKVTDERVPSGIIPGIDHLIHSPDGITREYLPISEFATYQTFIATVVGECGPITGAIVSPSCPVSGIMSGGFMDFAVTASSAQGGDPIILYEMDMDYNGSTFDTDFSNSNGYFIGAGPFTVPDPCPANIPKTFNVAFRATDSCVPPNVTIFATCDVTVDRCPTSDPNAHLWTITWGGASDTFALDTTTDSAGNIYVIGQFKGMVDFDPSTSVQQATSNGEWDIFLSKFNPDGSLLWFRTWGGVEWDYGTSVHLDNLGNVYAGGSYENTVDFNPGTGIENRTSNGYMDAYISKFTPTGDFIWVKTWGGTRFEYIYGMDIDVTGNIIATGWYELTVDFDPGTGEDLHTSFGMHDCFLTKLDSDGIFLWAKTWGCPQADWAGGVVSDTSGNIFVTGQFRSTVDFDPGTGEDLHASNGALDIFVSKFAPDGTYTWAKTWGGGFWDYGQDIEIDDFGNIYIVGDFDDYNSQPVDFDPGPGVDWHTSNGYHDAYISKLTSNGDFCWAHTWGALEYDGSNGVYVSHNGDVYVTGVFNGTVDFDPGTGVDWHSAHSSDRFDIFLSRFDSSGTYFWAGTWGGTENDFGISVCVDNSNFVYATGYFNGAVDFDPGSGVDLHTSTGTQDAFLSKLAN